MPVFDSIRSVLMRLRTIRRELSIGLTGSFEFIETLWLTVDHYRLSAGGQSSSLSFITLPESRFRRLWPLHGNRMTKIHNRVFSGEIVDLDDMEFIDCEFLDCELRYLGGAIAFVNTSLLGCRWVFGGSAKRTIDVLERFDLQSRIPELPENWIV